MLFTQLATLAASVASAQALSKGFNSGNLRTDQTPKTYNDFAAEFKKGANLPGTSGWNSIRLYTNVQGGTQTTPISAFKAAIDTKTTMLLGIWTSEDKQKFQNELTALQSAIDEYGSDFTDLVVGLSVGSEDLYRNSVTGQENDSDPGINPDMLVDYIKQVRKAISGTSLSDTPIGHVDTWDAWTNGTNSEVVENIDWVGMDTYPYFEYQKDNDISNAKKLFWDAYDKTEAAAGGKEVWITETGWPVDGKTEGDAVASPENAEKFWQEISCELQDNYHVWWYTLQDALPDIPNPTFGIIGKDINSDPLYDLSCKNTTKPSSSSSASGSASRTHKHGHATAAATGGSSSSGSSGYSSSGNGTAPGYGNGSGSNGTAPNASDAVPSDVAGEGPSGTSGGSPSGASGAPIEGQTGNSAAKAGFAAGAGLLGLFGLAAAL